MPAVTDHRKLITDIRAGKLQPVYILIGTETYFIDMIVDELEKHAINPADRDFNYNLYYGNDTNAETVINCAQQFPVMAERKLVILKEAQGLQNAKSDLDKFVPYISHPNYSTTLVITYTGEKTAAAAEIQKAANKADAVVFKSESPRDYQLAPYIKDLSLIHISEPTRP